MGEVHAVWSIGDSKKLRHQCPAEMITDNMIARKLQVTLYKLYHQSLTYTMTIKSTEKHVSVREMILVHGCENVVGKLRQK